ncbi:MAG: nucleotide-binding protein [Phycisphaerae bacterium]|nr:nucleotide-binding protein [Phycisphaerae bacterium]
MGKKKEQAEASGRAKENLRGKVKSDFPKDTIEEALRVASALWEANHGRPLPPVETATALGMSPGSSDFRTLLSSSIKYGLTKGSFNQAYVAIEELGRKILEPKTLEEKHEALVAAAFRPSTFAAIYDYFKGKKLPDPQFFQNTIVREFSVPREHAEKCVSVFNSNVEFLKLVRIATTGRWLSTEAVPTSQEQTERAEEEPMEHAEADLTGTAQPPVPPPSRTQKNAIFVGHGKNHVPMDQLKQILDQYKIPYKVAVQEPNAFRPISQKVADTMQECGASILIFTADEEFRDAEGNVVWRPNENVIYELGASSVLYGGRIIIFKEAGVRFPTNFRDIGYIEFEKDNLSAKTNELFKELIAFGLIRVTVGA